MTSKTAPMPELLDELAKLTLPHQRAIYDELVDRRAAGKPLVDADLEADVLARMTDDGLHYLAMVVAVPHRADLVAMRRMIAIGGAACVVVDPKAYVAFDPAEVGEAALMALEGLAALKAARLRGEVD